MKTSQKELIDELIAITRSNIDNASAFMSLDDVLLNRKPSPAAWSILECLEHINRYDSFYLPAIAKHLTDTNTAATTHFKSGFAGGYLVNAVIPKDNGKRMKTFAAMNPSGSLLNKDSIAVFLAGQQILLKQIEQAQKHDLNKVGIPVTFTRLVKLKLGDALRFMVYHNLRHIRQALRNLD